MELPVATTVNDEKGTKELAIKFAKELQNGQVIVLNGNLGSGKTFFIKQVIRNPVLRHAPRAAAGSMYRPLSSLGSGWRADLGYLPPHR